MTIDGVAEDPLWVEDAPARYSADRLHYQAALLEQYKLYVEMADRMSQRRGLTNTFFLSLNTGIVAAVGVVWNDRGPVAPGWLVLPLGVALAQCFTWFYLVTSYRQLNAAKYRVIGRLEMRLPASPYGRAEWPELGGGRDRSRYWPLTHIERWIPVVFATAYVAGFVAAVAA